MKSNSNLITLPPNSQLEVLGSVIIDGTSTFQDDLICSNLDVSGNTQINNTLTASSNSILKGVSAGHPTAIATASSTTTLAHNNHTDFPRSHFVSSFTSGGMTTNAGLSGSGDLRITAPSAGVYEMGYEFRMDHPVGTNVATNINIRYRTNGAGNYIRWGEFALSAEYFKYSTLMDIRLTGKTLVSAGVNDFFEPAIYHYTSDGTPIFLLAGSRFWMKKID